MEAIMSIMVISASSSLVVMILPGIVIFDDEVSSLRLEAQRCRNGIMELISDDGIIIHASSICRLQGNSPLMEVASGIRVELKVLGDEPTDMVLLSKGELPDSVSDCYALREPVGYEENGRKVSAALLEIIIW